jgi:hypothetical protein
VVLDWLAFIDCDLQSEEMQNAVIPLASSSSVAGGQIRWNRYLAAVAIHGASWKSLHRCFARLLKVGSLFAFQGLIEVTLLTGC